MPTDKTILIDDIGAFTQVAWLADGELEDYEVEEKHAGSRIGDVYLGHVERVIESLNAAFVDIGEGRACVFTTRSRIGSRDDCWSRL